MSKVSISQQIEELEREIGLRVGVYERQVTAGKMRRSVADFHMARIRAAKATLEWLRDNEAAIKAAVGERAA